MNISVIIATLNRPKDLENALGSILFQTFLPKEVIVIDQSTSLDTFVLVSRHKKSFKEMGIELIYLYQEERNLVKARNFGLAKAGGEIISFIDDDVMLYSNYYEHVTRTFLDHPEIGGISGNPEITDKLDGLKWNIRKFLMRLFFLNQFNGHMTISGFGVPIYEREINTNLDVEMLPGCNMNFRRVAIGSEQFDEWFNGYSFREDADFSYRISKKTALEMIPGARFIHNYSTQNRLNEHLLKEMEIHNYYYTFMKHKAHALRSKITFFYSLSGMILIDLLEFLSKLNRVKFNKLMSAFFSTLHLIFGEDKTEPCAKLKFYTLSKH